MTLAVTAVCGADDDEARRLAAPVRIAIAKNSRTRSVPCRELSNTAVSWVQTLFTRLAVPE